MQRELTFFWFVENWSCYWYGGGGWVKIPALADIGLEGTAWHLGLVMREEYRSGILLRLDRSDKNVGPEGGSIRFELSVLAEDGSVLDSRREEDSFLIFEGRSEIFFKVDKALFQQNFPRGILTVRCKVWTGEGSVQKVAPVCVRSRFTVETVSYLHVVERFSTLESNQKNTVEIPSRSENGSIASSSLYFTRDSRPDGEMMLEIKPFNNVHRLWKIKISLLGSGNVIVCGEDEKIWGDGREDIRVMPLSLTRQDILNQKSDHLPDDKLSLLCECSFVTGWEHEPKVKTRCEKPAADTEGASRGNVNRAARKDSAHPSVSEDMKALFIEQTLADVELKTETKTFLAHKSVLCARSPVLKRMLTSAERKKGTACIPVDDLSDDIVEHLLLFLYSDTVQELEWPLSSRLYYAANKYEVGRLKAVCFDFLVGNLDTSNAGELLTFAHAHSYGDLKKQIQHFILEHAEQVFGSEEWEEVMKTNSVLAAEMMHLKYKRIKLM